MKQTFALARQSCMFYVAMTVFSFLMLVIENFWWQAFADLLILGAGAFFMYSDAAARGERACATSRILESQQKEGRVPDEASQKRAFDRKNALRAYALLAAVFAAIALANLIAESHYPPVYVRTGDERAVSQDMAQSGGALPTAEASAINPFSVVARVAFMPVSFLYHVYATEPHGLNLWFLALAFLIPIPMCAGYLRGPALHEKLLSDIAKGKRKKARNLKVHKTPKIPKAPKMEV